MARNILISGTSSGIGKACAERLLQQGHWVIGIARRASDIDHARFTVLEMDLSQAASHQALAKKIDTLSPIDAVISNAGGGHFGGLENFSSTQICRSIEQNLLSHILLARTTLPTLKKNTRSDLIFIGSEAGLKGARQGSLYCAAKFGLRGFCQSLRQDCGRQNLHVGIVNPGMVRSEFFARLDFRPAEANDAALHCNDVVDAVLTLLNSPDHAVIDEINLSPLLRIVEKNIPPPD